VSGAESAGNASGSEGFRPDIEGLRAVAVGLVLAYHAGVPGATGGFVGVDVFFVVSGFLITGLLLRERAKTGTVSLSAFYARRARRLLPVAALAIVLTVIASALVLPPLRAADAAADGVAAGLYVSNIRFALKATDYLQAELAPSPLLHLWSLGVEEQFYLFWPALLLVATRARADVVRRAGWVIAAVIVASFGLSVWLTSAAEPWAFFSLPTRAWELGLGAVLAVGAGRLPRLPGMLAVSAGWIGLAMIAASAVVIDTSTPFPGIAALLPTVGTALALLPGMRNQSSAPVRLLGWSPMRFLGRISYSVYLWHWPLIVLPLAVANRLPLAVRVGLAVLAIVVGYASERWVEAPIRYGRFVSIRPRRSLALAAMTSAALVVGSLGVRSIVLAPIRSHASSVTGLINADDFPDPFGSPGASAARWSAGSPGSSAPSPATTPPATPGGPLPLDLTPSLVAARDDVPRTLSDGCNQNAPSTTIPECAYGDTGSATTVVLLGDSHANQWFPAIEWLAKERGWRLVSLTKNACTPASMTVWNPRMKRAYAECDRWRESAFQRIAMEHPALVIVGNSRSYQPAGTEGPSEPVRGRLLQVALETTLVRLEGLADAVVLMGDTPYFSGDPPECLSQHRDDVRACAQPRDKVTSPAWTNAEREAASHAGASYIDATGWACPSDPCPVVIGRYLVFRDWHHLSTPFVLALRHRLAEALTNALKATVASPPASAAPQE
jgi:peptidoglycan/LPS O-acetylase OafA/YrhL